MTTRAPTGSDVLARLNSASGDAARAELLRVCGSRVWARAVAARRPFTNRADLFSAAEVAWNALEPADWREAFSAHPRIGQNRTALGREVSAWSRSEQSGMVSADEGVRAALADAQRDYEARFGHVFLIRATGREAGEMLAACRTRLANDPATELQVAASEERGIGRLRLEKLLAEGTPSPAGEGGRQ